MDGWVGRRLLRNNPPLFRPPLPFLRCASPHRRASTGVQQQFVTQKLPAAEKQTSWTQEPDESTFPPERGSGGRRKSSLTSRDTARLSRERVLQYPRESSRRSGDGYGGYMEKKV